MPQPLNYSISGHIREQESGLGVPNLQVRAYDKDLLFDDLLGTTTTDANGAFSFQYGERDFLELFDHRPDIYLSIYTPQHRFLLDTRESIRWNAGQHEHIDVQIPQAQLGPLSPLHPADRVVGRLNLEAQALTIDRRGHFNVPTLPGFQTGGLPGAPALPQQTRYVALPAGGDVLRVQVTAGEPIRFEGPFNALPAQRPVPDLGLDPRTGRSLNPTLPFTMPNPRLYAHAAADHQAMVQLTRTRTLGPVQLVFLTVCPVQYESTTRSYLYYPDLTYEVVFDREKADRTTEQTRLSGNVLGEWYAESINAILDHPLTLPGPGVFWPLLQLEETPHLIITDNFAWPASITNPNGTTRPPTLADRQGALSGDLIAEFGRLADWRTTQGMRSQVVSITDIVSGDLGDFTQNGFARDLPEILRNFLKYMHTKLGTTYVVLGGDVNVVPIRYVAGPLSSESVSITPGTTNPPDKRGGYHAAGTSVSKLHADFDPTTTTPLCRYQDGQIIPYNRLAGPDSLGWYCTTEDDFTKKDDNFTRLPDATLSRFVILEGPAATLANDYYYWVDDSNSIPTDLYYASLLGNAYDAPGKHDFDGSNNGLYGQYFWNGTAESSLDGGLPEADIWVGRIPAESGSQARAYVDKLITYEDLKTPGSPTSTVDPTYTKHVLFAADHWSGVGQDRQTDLSVPPAASQFTHAPDAWFTHLTLSFDIALVDDVPNWTLYAVRNGERTEIHYGMLGNQTFWFFADDDTFMNQSDAPTRFVLIFGNGTTNDADSFVWYPTAIDQGMAEKENMRDLMHTLFPAFTDVQRYYADFYNLTAPPILKKLEQAAFKKALNQGPHFVSLTGHGWWGGCCSLDALNQPDFTNNRQYFIAFADSCSTARPDKPIGFDGSDSLGEVSVLDPDGGAVAYVGNTRYGWIGVGAGYEQMFWQLLADGTALLETTPPKPHKTARVGVAAGLRLTTGSNNVWTNYVQMLYGDPALKVWTDVPGSKPHINWKPDRDWATISVVHPGDPVMSRFKRGDLITNLRVTLTADDGSFFVSGRTNSFGQVRLSLRGYNRQSGPLRLTVVSPTSQLVSTLVDGPHIGKMDFVPETMDQNQ